MVEIRGRHIKIVLYLLEQKYPVSASKISKEIDVNINTLRKDIPQLENLLKENGLSLIAKPKIGFKIDGPPEKIENLRKKLNSIGNKILDRKRRIWYITEIFLSKEKIPTIEDLCESLNTSRPTIAKHIKEIKLWLNEKGIKLIGKPGVGYELKGEEENIRDAIVDTVIEANAEEINIIMARLFNQHSLNILNEIIKDINFMPIKQYLDILEEQSSTVLIDKDYVGLLLKIIVSIKRIKNNHFIIFEPKRLFNIMQNPIYRVIYKNIPIIENNYNIKFSSEEIAYFTLSFISSKLQGIAFVNGQKENYDMKKYKDYALQITEIANDIFELPISEDKEFIDMLSLHLKSTLIKIKYGVRIDNPLLQKIKEECPLQFNIAERISIMLGRKMRINIPDEETGYIAMYIAMAIEKLKRQKKTKVVLICPMGIATSKLLYFELINQMPEVEVLQINSFKDILEGKLDPAIDLIVSTVPLPDIKIPNVVVSPFLNNDDKKIIREALRIKKQNTKAHFCLGSGDNLDESIIFVNIETNSDTEIIKLLGHALAVNGYVKENFTQSVIKRENKFPTGLNLPIPIALPHSKASFTLKTGFAFATLKYPVAFHEMGEPEKTVDVGIVLMPVLTTSSQDGSMLYELLQKCRDYKIATKLLKCSSAKEIREILMKARV